MGWVNIAQELANDGGFNDDLIIENEDRYEGTRIEGEKLCRAGSIHIDDPLFEGDAYFRQADVGAVGPCARVVSVEDQLVLGRGHDCNMPQ